MKIDMKTILIVVVVAVAAFLVWKMKAKDSGNVADDGLTAAQDHTSLDYILTHIAFTQTERDAIEQMRRNAEASNTTRSNLQAKAYDNNLSFDQQLVCDAIWNLYHNTDQWSTRGYSLTSKVKKL